MADSRDARYTDHEDHFRDHFRDHHGTDQGAEYGRYEPAYRSGFRYGTSSKYAGRSFDELEPEMRRRHEKEYGEGSWKKQRVAVRHAFERGRKALKREQPGESKAGTSGPSGSGATASGDPGGVMREGDDEVFGDEKRRRNT